ncbi:uncharacterized protein (DUF2336 family) [Methylopila capsulata]|uniref:Uncharacterized protein (DUF2336 family) n=1 Tax=Methylopila capsulata TaxID=61654 RepID=A0A9W6IV21_9HYPH|nr:DUF2336 domain-containing protein [Methylopila capsulata]MBM7850524.1 uncharacterized protein (DUF2336 family) [Methylopila capsulata]GLK55820.1 hypothetical protein GCM10008170_18390 [Methylopila capsulata]
MIVERFVEWAQDAPAEMRADAVAALARSYLHGDLEHHVRADVEQALVYALDDRSLAVRAALADVFAGSPDAPHAILLSLANDAPDVATPVLERSPLLSDVELVDLVAQGGGRVQAAIARRRPLSAPLCAAIAEVGEPEACVALIANPDARLMRSSAARIATRHGANGAVRDALFARDDLGAELRLILMRAVASALQGFVSGCGWLAPDRARRAADDACDRGALAIAAGETDRRAFVAQLAARGEFSPSLALRALLGGDVMLFEAALSALSGQSPARVSGFVRDFSGRGFEAVYRDSGLPLSALPVFRAALSATREFGPTSGANAELSRRIVERALAGCPPYDRTIEPLRAMLRRFAAEAARSEARRLFDAPMPSAAAA